MSETHIHLHIESIDGTAILAAIGALDVRLARIEERQLQEVTTDARFAEQVLSVLGQINTRTTEIKTDQADLLRRLDESPTDAERAEIMRQLNANNDELGEIAGGYTPVPVDPGTVPGSDPIDPPVDGGAGSGNGGVTGPVDDPADPSAPPA